MQLQIWHGLRYSPLEAVCHAAWLAGLRDWVQHSEGALKAFSCSRTYFATLLAGQTALIGFRGCFW